MKILFLSGIVDPDELDDAINEIRKTGINARIDVAANNMAKLFVEGFEHHFSQRLTLIGDKYLPIRPSYGNRLHKKTYWDHSNGIRPGTDIHVFAITFNKFFYFITKFVSIIKELLQYYFTSEKILIIVYSVHIPYLLSACFMKALKHRLHLCCIVPDLPQFMDSEIDRKPIKRQLKKIETMLTKRLLRYADSRILLTKYMADWIGKHNGKNTIIEGLCPVFLEPKLDLSLVGKTKKTVVYTGTLDKRFGIIDLIDAFSLLDDPQYRLVICGYGDSVEVVKSKSLADSRIEYLGIKSRVDVLDIQRQASLLVNPRRSSDEYCLYSFPSKTMEYMLSGTPVLMRKLPGIPDEYMDYIHFDKEETVASLGSCIDRLLSRSEMEIVQDGLRSRQFIIEKKNNFSATLGAFKMIKSCL